MEYKIILLSCITSLLISTTDAADTLVKYTEQTVPNNVLDLWKDFDSRSDPLETEVIKEWKEDGIVRRYVIFKVGRFNGADSRIAAYYTFPEGATSVPGIVWAHGGGQRAEKERGDFLAKLGYATLDFNWGGRPLEDGIEQNTDWGKVDPTQGKQFYAKALRKGVYRKFDPDPHTIDSVVSPRNYNMFLLSLAGRRGITFMEQQAEVDAERIGFTGFSIGGIITSLTSIDKRLKAVVPMVGGSGFIRAGFPGVPDSARPGKHTEEYAATLDPKSYWPHVTCPVMFLSASDDFNAPLDNIYKSMALLSDQDSWRVSQHIHKSHNLGPEQWILLNLWFDKYLKGKPVVIPKVAPTELTVVTQKSSATFSVTPDQSRELEEVEIYYSHDPNPRSRFWITAESNEKDGVWSATLPVKDGLPLYAFANCDYPLNNPVSAFQGTAKYFTISSKFSTYLPDAINVERLFDDAKHQPLFSDIEKDGFRDWGVSSRYGICTYKFRDPRASTPGAGAVLKVIINPSEKDMEYQFRITKNKYITGSKERQITYAVAKRVKEPGVQEILLKASDFAVRKKDKMADWSNISTLNIDVRLPGSRDRINFDNEEGKNLIKRLEWIIYE